LPNQSVKFNSSFLANTNGGDRVDLTKFENGATVLPGVYAIDIIVNQKRIAFNYNTNFFSKEGSDVAMPCVTKSIFEKIGFDLGALESNSKEALATSLLGDTCLDLNKFFIGTSMFYDQANLRLEISVPQASLIKTPRGFTSQDLWSSGLPSATIAYDSNFYRSSTNNSLTTHSNLSLRTGINYENWHLRQNSSLSLATSDQASDQFKYQYISTYLVHDIPNLKSSLTLGDTFTDGSLFNSVASRGITLATDDRMYPDSQNNFAPVVRGIAKTNARIVVSQNGVKIYETTVSPGAFEIDDIYPTGFGGELAVTVYEADGSQEIFYLPFNSLARLMRPGIWRYNVFLGETRNAAQNIDEPFTQATIQYGVNNFVTAYAGNIFAGNYVASQLGLAFNTSIGAIGVDVTHSKLDIQNYHLPNNGENYRISFNKFFPETKTAIILGAYRYSTQGYWSFADSLLIKSKVDAGGDVTSIEEKKSQIDIAINQALYGKWGHINLTATQSNYWNSNASLLSFQAGYSNSLKIYDIPVNFNLVALKTQNTTNTAELSNKTLLATITFPLGKVPNQPIISSSINETKAGNTKTTLMQETISGTAGEYSNFSYGVTSSQSSTDKTFGVSGKYSSSISTISASLGEGNNYSQQSISALGGVVIHPGGIIFSNQMSDTIGIIEAFGAEGARIESATGTLINSEGYAIVPYLRPYRVNTMSINPEGSSQDVEFINTSQDIVPRANTVSLLHFETKYGRSVMFTLVIDDGVAVPFGAEVKDSTGLPLGIVGQYGNTFLRGIPETGRLTAKWGSTSNQECQFDYSLPKKNKDDKFFLKMKLNCKKI